MEKGSSASQNFSQIFSFPQKSDIFVMREKNETVPAAGEAE